MRNFFLPTIKTTGNALLFSPLNKYNRLYFFLSMTVEVQLLMSRLLINKIAIRLIKMQLICNCYGRHCYLMSIFA